MSPSHRASDGVAVLGVGWGGQKNGGSARSKARRTAEAWGSPRGLSQLVSQDRGGALRQGRREKQKVANPDLASGTTPSMLDEGEKS